MANERDPTPILVGDVAVFRMANGDAVIHTGSDGRNRCRIGHEDRLGVATAILPAGTVAVARGRIRALERIEALAQEYAESRLAWEAMLPVATDSGVPVGEWDAAQRRQDAARTNLLGLFAALRPGDAAPSETEPLPAGDLD